ncbi:hypothetical protein BH10ACT1_BH10ACT1_03800 [soil metagenome]
MGDDSGEEGEDLRSILNGLPALVGYWDADGRNRWANDAYLEYFGLHPAEVRGRHISDVLGPDLYEESRPYIEGVLRGEPQLFDRAIPTPSGEVRFTQGSYVPDVFDGVVRGFLALVTDITGRRLVELALSEAEERFRTLFRSSPVGTFIADRSMLVVDVNPAGAALLGRTEQDLLGTSVLAFTHADDVDESRERFRLLWEGASDPYRLEKRYLHADGHVLWTQLDVTLLRDAAGAPTYALGHIQDITTQRLHQQQLEHLADHDPLTGLLNRRGLLRELDRCTAHAHRYGDDGALLVLDLDNFKLVNDTFGHQAGDELLADIAGRLAARLRSTDVIARLGGDEFAVILPHTDREQAGVVADSLVQTTRDQPSGPMHGLTRLSVSIGISMLEDADDAGAVLAQADLAMYDAKESGRDRVGWHRSTTERRPPSQLGATGPGRDRPGR